MEFWKEHAALRMIVMAVLAVAGLVLVIAGWKMTGKMSGLCIMIVGLAALLGALAVYNKPFENPKKKK